MPNHVHLLVRPRGKWKFSEFMGTLKRNVARDINIILSNGNVIRNLIEGADSRGEGVDSRGEAADSNPRLQDNFQITHREHPHITFEEYKNHFEILHHMQHRFRSRNGTYPTVPKFRWQKSYHDHIIRNDRDYTQHLRYIYNNAVKHRLVENAEEWSWMWVKGMEE
jgi:REP element-mobilizing transposase RayT